MYVMLCVSHPVCTQQALLFAFTVFVADVDLLRDGRADPCCPVCMMIASHQHDGLGVVNVVLFSLAYRGAIDMLNSSGRPLEPWSAWILSWLLYCNQGRLGLLCW